MFQKIKRWYRSKRNNRVLRELYQPEESYTREQLEKAFMLGYTDGKRDGLAVAREQATNSLKEILWQQNKNQTKRK